MKTLSKLTILAFVMSLVMGAAPLALANTPILSATYQGGNGNNVLISITAANPNSAISLFYRQSSALWTQVSSVGQTDFSGNFTQTISIPNQGGNTPVQIYVIVGGLQSATVQVYPGSNGGCTYNCNIGGLTLSQNSLSISSGQTASVTISYPVSGYTNFYVSSNTNANVASATVTGSTLSVYGSNSGSTTLSVCSGGSANVCASLYVTVNGNCYNNNCGNNNNGSVTFSPSNPTMSVGQTLAVSINSTAYSGSYNAYSNNAYYVSSNSNSSVVSATISGTALNLYANQTGSSSITVCSTGLNFCGTVYVTVSNSGCNYSCSNSLSLSQSNLSLISGQSSTVTVSSSNYYAGSYYISSNSNSSVATASVSSNSVYITGNNSGSTTINICQSGNGYCASLYVTVSGNNCNSYNNYNCNNCNYNCSGSISLSLSNVTLNANQSTNVVINGTGSYYISSNSNSSAAAASISGNSLFLYGNAGGNSTISICQSGGNYQCASVYVTVNGSGIGNGGSGVTFSQNPVNVNLGQSQSVSLYGSYGGSYYVASNSNSYVASANISGNLLTLYGQTVGNVTLSVCQGYGSCGSLYVTVGGSNNYTGSLTLSQTSLSLSQGQSGNVNIYGNGSYYISSNNNPAAVTANINGNTLDVYASGSLGTTTISVCQNNGSGCASLLVTVSGAYTSYGSSLYFTTTNLPPIMVGQYYNYQLQVTGGNPPYYYTLTSGILPAGLSLSSSGMISGMPVVNSAYQTFSVQASDSYGHTAVQTFNLNSNGSYGSYGYGQGGSGLSFPGGGSGSVQGASIYPNGELISEGPTVYIVYKNTKTAFGNGSAFSGLGYKFSNVLAVGSSGLINSEYIVNTPYVKHPWGSWVQSGNTVYFSYEQGLIPVPDWNTFLNNGGQANLIVPANSYDFRLPILAPMTLSDSRLQ